MPIPESPEMLTPEWFTKALGIDRLEPGAEVRAINIRSIGQEQGWVGMVSLVELTYTTNVEGAPSRIVAKLTPKSRGGVFGTSEGRFYEELAVGRELSIPQCYFAQTSRETGTSILLLEDLSDLEAIDFVDGCSPQDAEHAVRALAGIHASWWNDSEIVSSEWLLSISSSKFPEWWSSYARTVKNLLPHVKLPQRFLAFGDRFAADLAGVADRIESSPFTIIHRDSHVDNLLFDRRAGRERAVVIDWQTVGVGKGVSDIAYLLISSLSPQDRMSSERYLVDTYHRILTELGVEGYSLEQCWDDYIVSVAAKMFITVAATTILDNNTPRRRAWRERDLERLTAFFRDHNPITRL